MDTDRLESGGDQEYTWGRGKKVFSLEFRVLVLLYSVEPRWTISGENCSQKWELSLWRLIKTLLTVRDEG